jgi:hypothetical protein
MSRGQFSLEEFTELMSPLSTSEKKVHCRNREIYPKVIQIFKGNFIVERILKKKHSVGGCIHIDLKVITK